MSDYDSGSGGGSEEEEDVGEELYKSGRISKKVYKQAKKQVQFKNAEEEQGVNDGDLDLMSTIDLVPHLFQVDAVPSALEHNHSGGGGSGGGR